MDPILIDPSSEREILDFRPLGFRDLLVLGRYQYAAAHRPLPEHIHGRMLEICYLARGQQTYRVGQTSYNLTGGDVFLTFPHEPHGTGTAPESKGTLYWCLLRLPEKNERLFSLSPGESRQLMALLLALPRQFRLGTAPAKDLDRVFAIHRQAHLALGKAEMRNILLRFLFDLVRACDRQGSRLSPAIGKALQFVQRQPQRMFSIREVARQCGLSESRFKERFRCEVGVPPAEYMMRRKIDAAKSLLLSGNQTVTKIALDLGFSSSQYFATTFRRYTGRTPGEYRRNGE
jgi:AraC-like DNA-binding protein